MSATPMSWISLKAAGYTELPHDAAWRDLPFLRVDEHAEVTWAPARAKTGDDDRSEMADHVTDWIIGTGYAVALVEYFREYAGDDTLAAERLHELVKAIMDGGRYETVEQAFFTALGFALARGEMPIGMSSKVVARWDDEPPPAA